MNELERRLIQAGQTFTVFLSSAEGEVRMPSGKVAKPDIADNKDGTVTVKYAPTEAGLHEMDIKYDGIHIPGTTAQPSGPLRSQNVWDLNPKGLFILLFTGSPLQFFVDYMNSGNVSAYGPGLIHGTVNKPAVFTVDTKDAGEGGRPRSFFIQPSSSPLRNPVSMITCSFLQVVCLWPLRGRQRLTSAVWTTRTAPAPCPTCRCCLETTASSSNTTTSTSQEAPFLLRSLVTVHESCVSLSSLSQCNQVSVMSQVTTP